ncbi:MAG: hypothetical protein IT464_04645 [Planctomycetes bacterium]|nr:hypothetical protein [Planctomycetota bacterium]
MLLVAALPACKEEAAPEPPPADSPTPPPQEWAEPALRAEIERCFSLLKQAAEQRNGKLFRAQFDTEAYATAIVKNASRFRPSPRELEAFTDGVSSALEKDVDEGSSIRRIFMNVRVRRIEHDGAICVVSTSHIFENLLGRTVIESGRWWFTYREHVWRIFDWELALESVRATEIRGQLVDSAISGTDVRGLALIHSAMQEIDFGNYEKADLVLASVATGGLNDRFLAMFWATRARAAIHLQDFARGLEYSQKALDALPDFHAGRVTRSRCLLVLKRHDEALVETDWLISKLGADAVLLIQKGFALHGLGRRDDAWAAFNLALDDYALPDAVTGLALSASPARIDEALKAIDRLPDPKQGLLSVLADLDSYPASPAASAFWYVQFTRTGGPGVQHALRRAIEVAGEAGMFDAAFALLKRYDDYGYTSEVPARMRVWAVVALKSPKPAEQLTQTQHSRLLYRLMAAASAADRNLELLGQLNAALRARDRDDGAWTYYTAYLLHAEEKYAQAEEQFEQAASAMAKTDELLTPALSGRSECRLALGRYLDAYRGMGTSEWFMRAATGLYEKAETDLLKQLVELRQADDAKDPSLPAWRGVLQLTDGKNLDAAKSFVTYSRGVAEDQVPQFMYVLWTRAEIRAGRTQEAMKPAAAAKRVYATQLPLLMAKVAQKRLRDAIEIAQQMISESGADAFVPLYDDPDIGANLRSAAYAELHKSAPPPAGD